MIPMKTVSLLGNIATCMQKYPHSYEIFYDRNNPVQPSEITCLMQEIVDAYHLDQISRIVCIDEDYLAIPFSGCFDNTTQTIYIPGTILDALRVVYPGSLECRHAVSTYLIHELYETTTGIHAVDAYQFSIAQQIKIRKCA